MSTYIIAEAGVNHNGSLDLAKKLVDTAKEAGADAVKFQTFKAAKVISKVAPKAEYQISSTGEAESQLEMVRKLELDEKSHLELLTHCQKRGIQFLSTPFDLESVDMLVNKLGVLKLKVPSGEITNPLLLLKTSRTGRPIILSTGMCTLEDIRQALGVIAFGYLGKQNPSPAAFAAAFESAEGQKVLKEKVTILHCTTEYPAPFEDVNLRAMERMRAEFGLPVGYSDHTPGITVPIAAVALGAVVIEKHITLDRNLPGPDHLASIEPHELNAMVAGIRQVEKALGKAEKFVAPSEAKNQVIARRSLVATQSIKKGEPFTEANLTVKRPGSGLSPFLYWEKIGQLATRDYTEDEPIQ